MIAILPLLCQKFWHKHFGNIAILMGGGMALYYIFGRHDTSTPSHTFFEYIQFISLISALYFAANGIMIRVNRSALPKVNAMFLFLGAVLSNLIGTTGASILLIKPFISLNEDRIKPFHVVFFIFVVSNVGGGLTPIGDPPLFLGFLKGVPFFWTATHVFLLWLTALVLLCSLFFVIDHRALSADAQAQQAIADEEGKERKPLLSIEGAKSFLWLGGIIGAVFLDPNVLDWVPALYLGEEKISFLRECILIACAFGAYKTARRDILIHNDFSFFPIKEVALLFVGIFGTMMPALQLIKHMSSDAGGLLTPSFLFWSTGLLSGFLDNAPHLPHLLSCLHVFFRTRHTPSGRHDELRKRHRKRRVQPEYHRLSKIHLCLRRILRCHDLHRQRTQFYGELHRPIPWHRHAFVLRVHGQVLSAYPDPHLRFDLASPALRPLIFSSYLP